MLKSRLITQALQEECRWLEQVKQAASLDTFNGDEHISWATYHASKHPVPDFAPVINELLPVFPDDSKSVAVIHHVMDVIRNTVLHLNPCQVTVITED
ncbi:unnamed protein product [Caretta caretta]